MIVLADEYKTALAGKTFIDLFAGIGGFRLPLESFGAKCVFSCEWDKDAQHTYQDNYGELPSGDITKIDENDIPEHDILCAGFPCQPFSISGKQLGFNDTRGTLFFDIARIVKKHHPKIVLLENVKNFVSHDGGRTLQVVVNTLQDLGYDVFYDIYNSAEYGVPQKRERVFIVCLNKAFENNAFSKPKTIPLTRHLEDILLPADAVKDFIIDRNDIIFKDNVVEQYCDSPLRIGHINKGRQGERIYSVKGTSITLSAYGGGIGAKTGLYLVDGQLRRLAPRECARLDGFPDTFKVPANRNIAYKQFGNSVVIDVIQYILLQIINEKCVCL